VDEGIVKEERDKTKAKKKGKNVEGRTRENDI
jgi:hypothetical protein